MDSDGMPSAVAVGTLNFACQPGLAQGARGVWDGDLDGFGAKTLEISWFPWSGFMIFYDERDRTMPGCYGPMATNLGCDPRFSPYGCSGCMGCGCGMPGMGCTPGMTPGRICAGNWLILQPPSGLEMVGKHDNFEWLGPSYGCEPLQGGACGCAGYMGCLLPILELLLYLLSAVERLRGPFVNIPT